MRSPNPLLSSATATSSSATGAGECDLTSKTTEDDVLRSDNLALLLAVFDTGVRFLIEGIEIETSFSVWSAPVIVKFVLFTFSEVLALAILRIVRVDMDLVTRPSLSSLKELTASAIFFVCLVVVVALASCLRGAGFGFATRDATFARGGRGINAGVLVDVEEQFESYMYD